jgi:serine protein kinase
MNAMSKVWRSPGAEDHEQRETFRTSIRKIYGQKISVDPNYDFMDNLELVKGVTDVRLKSDIAGAGSLIGALANRTNEENQKLYDRMVDTMLNKLGYCRPAPRKPSNISAPRRTKINLIAGVNL